ncbi:rhodanese-like domain-containing protein [Calothrix sp. 336/3]|uniref:rhodanese-like domain-containing protein n=1 Tax=Calothrix sp. 336/3 TaxID=1337936 RepID=UPI0004E30F52|nr:rhodanese-like domain-containing protein [Calothrix sp. 336/3]AKG24155.1 rhodanese-related sulfurtransferase [Calothrix sp. 336/3]
MSGTPFTQPLAQVSVQELQQRLSAGDRSIQLIDVREPQEVAIASIDGFLNLPLSQFAEWSENIHARLEQDAETLVLCHHGIRSAQMCQWLIAQGFTNVKNISGGIAAYSQIVDPDIPQY